MKNKITEYFIANGDWAWAIQAMQQCYIDDSIQFNLLNEFNSTVAPQPIRINSPNVVWSIFMRKIIFNESSYKNSIAKSFASIDAWKKEWNSNISYVNDQETAVWTC